MVEREITCIVCPQGCKIMVKTDGTHVELVSGNKCERGREYAELEAVNPKRMLTSSVLVIGGEWPLVSVRTVQPIPKNRIFDVLKEIKDTVVEAPVKCGEILLRDVGGTGVDIIATKTVNEKK